MDREDASLRALVRKRELDLTVDATGTDERRVERIDPIGRHDHLTERTHTENGEIEQRVKIPDCLQNAKLNTTKQYESQHEHT